MYNVLRDYVPSGHKILGGEAAYYLDRVYYIEKLVKYDPGILCSLQQATSVPVRDHRRFNANISSIPQSDSQVRGPRLNVTVYLNISDYPMARRLADEYASNIGSS